MPDHQEKAWSDNPNTPKFAYLQYPLEKSTFAGLFISSILYGVSKTPQPTHPSIVLTKFARFILGVLVVLFFKCMAALFNPVHRRGEPIKWGLVSYTVIMFSLVTAETAMTLDLRSLSYIDNREFPGGGIIQLPGPYGYQFSISLDPINIIPAAVLILSNWLADGHLVGSSFDVILTRPGA